MFMVLSQIQMISFLQEITPSTLIGKVMSIIMVLPFLAQAFGQILFGVLFGQFEPWLVIFAASAVSLVTAVYSKGFFRKSS